ncbi:secondary thiamine-phosphate synthase enzyme YjbQ [Marinicella sp. S1101]|uniref:secondary thiamine-phosphate synthase enzyme YjbQ n=1 Tax=Marinicella marina TaxID=2996016 RepID=UPI002260B791|nr:secondary thiamine-phosphate synthase enzyme YjbQ [Marinicella marina]MCX7553587.1 secondary thiamine-phosphate synthase enzyme YjbQ [Marinicella marina]MDJ1140211.1 secondary thiamine-phosphate synthase enzyme YjbQ [Marinicella marina]
MKQFHLSIKTPGRGYYLITDQINRCVEEALAGLDVGLLHVFLQHSSASLTINENADPTVREDFKNFEEKLVPRNFPYRHNYEGDDDMPAHIKSSLMGCQLSIPISGGRLALGTWQGIYLCEHRDQPHQRNMVLTIY